MKDSNEAWCSVLIASSNAGVRRRWNDALHSEFPTLLAASRTELERRLVKFTPSILFVDTNLLGNDFVKNLHVMQQTSLATKIVALASAPSDAIIEIMALQAGARGYCNRDLVPALMKRAAHVILKGEIWCGRSILPYLLRTLKDRTRQRHSYSPSLLKELEALTVRQREIADRIAMGSSNKQIASSLNITEGAVKAQITIIFRKLAVSDRLQLALLLRDKTDNYPG